MIWLFAIALTSWPFPIDSWYLRCCWRWHIVAYRACRWQQASWHSAIIVMVNLHVNVNELAALVACSQSAAAMGSCASFGCLAARSAPVVCRSGDSFMVVYCDFHIFDSFELLPRKFCLLLVLCNRIQVHSSVLEEVHWKASRFSIYIWNSSFQALPPFPNYVGTPWLECQSSHPVSSLACLDHIASSELV